MLDNMPPEEGGQSLGRIDLVATWAQWNLPAAVAQADKLPQLQRDRALVAIARRLVSVPGGLQHALNIANRIQDNSQRAVAIALCAAHLPAEQAGVAKALAGKALTLGSGLQGLEMFELKKLCATALAAGDADAAVALASEITDEDARAEALASVAQKTACSYPQKAVSIVEGIDILSTREQALVLVIGRLAPRMPQYAYELAGRLRSANHKAAALVAIATALQSRSSQEQ